MEQMVSYVRHVLLCVYTIKFTYFMHADSLQPRASSISGLTSARCSTLCQGLGKKLIDCMFKLSNTSDLSSFLQSPQEVQAGSLGHMAHFWRAN